MAFSFVGSRFSEEQIMRPGCSLFVTVSLPAAEIAAVVTVVYPERQRHGWFVGTIISQMSERDAGRLAEYINKCAELEPVLTMD